MVDLKVNIFKKQKNFSYEESINHNILIFLLYENIKDRNVFKKFEKIKKLRKDLHQEKPSITINDNDLSQDDLNSLFEFEKIENLLDKIPNKKGNFIEIGSGAGRTTQTILSLKEEIKYVVADIPPAINLSYKNIKKLFPEKKVYYAFEIENEKDFLKIYEKQDVIYILPHQIKYLPTNFLIYL